MASSVDLGREAFARRAWGEAHALLQAAGELGPDDLERLAIAAYLVGQDDESAQAWHRAEAECLRLGRPDQAARCAFWQGLALLFRGDAAQANGWLARAERLADTAGECAARGFLLVPPFLGALRGGDHEAAHRMAAEMVAVAGQCDDKDLMAFGLLCSGEAALARGDRHGGMKFLDEAMVSVTTGEVAPIPAGIVYCAVIETCMAVFDLRRAAEWTEALSNWCDTQPDLVPYRGQCLVHRSQVLQAHGRWTEAAEQADLARRRLAEQAHPALGSALYQQADLHRLRGDFAAAGRGYAAAAQEGKEPLPGLALLRLAEGRLDDAVAAARRMAAGTETPPRPDHLAGAVEIFLAAGDRPAARAAADTLASVAQDVDGPLLQAMAGQATGRVLLADGDIASALAALAGARRLWRELAMPYDAARTAVELALARRAQGDHDAAHLEFEAARAAFERIGAGPDLARLAQLDKQDRKPPDTLTEREREVLRLVATGQTNRQIAAVLTVSEHTVARHLQNMFTKLGLSSRSAATAYAYEHDLV